MTPPVRPPMHSRTRLLSRPYPAGAWRARGSATTVPFSSEVWVALQREGRDDLTTLAEFRILAAELPGMIAALQDVQRQLDAHLRRQLAPGD